MRMAAIGAGLAMLAGAAQAQMAQAQAVARYPAPTGTVAPDLTTTMLLAAGGTVTLHPVVGPDCYLGDSCGFPSGYVGTALSYVLPDGSSASLANYHGVFAPDATASGYLLKGEASGTDSAGRAVHVAEAVTMTITCRSGRGGGCSKVYTGGLLRVKAGP